MSHPEGRWGKVFPGNAASIFSMVEPSAWLDGPAEWPDGHRAAAIFTFDLDAEELWTMEDGDEWDIPSVRARGEFAPKVAVPRILEVFRKYDLPCTFFIPGVVADRYPETVQRIHEEGHEIGHHGYSHTTPKNMSDEREEAEFVKAMEVFEDLIGEVPVGYRCAGGDLSEHTLSLLDEHGMRYDSSIKNNDIPYFRETSVGSLLEIPNELSLNDWPHWGFNYFPTLAYQSGITPNEPVFASWRGEFDGLYKRGRMFILTNHPQVIGRAGRVDGLEGLVQHVLATGDTWITTCAGVAEHWHAHYG